MSGVQVGKDDPDNVGAQEAALDSFHLVFRPAWNIHPNYLYTHHHLKCYLFNARKFILLIVIVVFRKPSWNLPCPTSVPRLGDIADARCQPWPYGAPGR